MKKILGIALLGTLFSSYSYGGSSDDPKQQNLIQAGTALIGAMTSYGTAANLLSTPDPTPVTKILAGNAATAGTGQIVVAGLSITNASKLESDRNSGQGEIGSSGGLDLGDGSTSGGRTPGSVGGIDPKKIGDLKDTALAKKAEVEKRLQELLPSGVSLEDYVSHPQDYLTPEEMEELNREKEKMKAENDKNYQKNLESMLGFDASSLEAQGGLPSFNFNFDDFFKSQFGNGEAEDFYGNVSLKVLKPDSKLSLFERVSRKLKEVWKKDS